ncbi:MAG: DUF501 domain-containing protein [Ilumatobacteraceae bacterium]
MSFSNSTTPEDRVRITELLGRSPQGDFDVVVRDAKDEPIVVCNAPLLYDGTPMPTRYWLVGPEESLLVGRLEAAGGVKRAEAEVDAEQIANAHLRYAKERDSQIAPSQPGPRPHGGVGGTRVGVKCLHAHYAWWLAGGDDPVGSWVANKLGADKSKYTITNQVERTTSIHPRVVAAIDIGTNSTNLLIVDADGNELAREVHVTRLGEGVAATGSLNQDAMSRTLQRLAKYKTLIDSHGVESVRVVATEASRRASNVNLFLNDVAALTGVTPELLPASDEGRLTYDGALGGLPISSEKTIVIDIGGGSTEIMIGSSALEHVISIPIGAVVITEKELHHDPPKPEELTNAIGLATDFVEDIIREQPGIRDATRVFGVAGTIVTIGAVELGLHSFDAARLHGLVITRGAVEDVFRTLATETLADRRHNPGLPEQRADIIVGGCCVLVGIMRKLQLNSITVSTRNILDGIVAELRSKVVI